MSIPIVNAKREIVAWTDTAPVVVRNRLRHRQAERLLGGPIHCVEIALTDRKAALQAGAPRNWRDAWRCMALCSDERIGSVEQIGRFLAEPGAPAAQTQSAAGPRPGGAFNSPAMETGER
jgi:hypothetical protein